MLKCQLRYLRVENSEEPDKLQFRTLYENNITMEIATDWEDIPVHIKQVDGSIIDQGSGKIISIPVRQSK